MIARVWYTLPIPARRNIHDASNACEQLSNTAAQAPRHHVCCVTADPKDARPIPATAFAFSMEAEIV